MALCNCFFKKRWTQLLSLILTLFFTPCMECGYDTGGRAAVLWLWVDNYLKKTAWIGWKNKGIWISYSQILYEMTNTTSNFKQHLEFQLLEGKYKLYWVNITSLLTCSCLIPCRQCGSCAYWLLKDCPVLQACGVCGSVGILLCTLLTLVCGFLFCGYSHLQSTATKGITWKIPCFERPHSYILLLHYMTRSLFIISVVNLLLCLKYQLTFIIGR